MRFIKSMKHVGGAKCSSFKKNKPPKCIDQPGCKWVVKQGCKPKSPSPSPSPSKPKSPSPSPPKPKSPSPQKPKPKSPSPPKPKSPSPSKPKPKPKRKSRKKFIVKEIDLSNQYQSPPLSINIGRYTVPALGMGTLPLGVTYAPGGRPKREDAIKLIHYSLDKGVRFFDTADTYGADNKDLHYVEKLLTEAIDSYKGGSLVDEVVVGTKTGMKRINSSVRGWRPKNFKNIEDFKKAVMNSYVALGSKPIKLWSLHHTDGYDVDDPTKFIEVCNAIKDLLDENIIENVGLCNCSTAHLDIAREIIPIVAVQNSFSLYDKTALKKRVRKIASKSNKNEIIDYCRENNIIFTPYGALGGTQSRDGRRNLQNDFGALYEIAEKKGVSPQALILSWMRHKFPFILHIIGTRNIAHLDDYLSSINIHFTHHEISELDKL